LQKRGETIYGSVFGSKKDKEQQINTLSLIKLEKAEEHSKIRAMGDRMVAHCCLKVHPLPLTSYPYA
jgi:hypothetical protein